MSSFPTKPEDVLDQYFCFKKSDLMEVLAQRGVVYISAANFISVFESMQEAIGKKYFVMDAQDPLVATIIVTYIKLMNSAERMKKKLND